MMSFTLLLSGAGRGQNVLKNLGISYDPDGLLWSHELRTTHLPIECYIRDWMHIVVSGGITNNWFSVWSGS